ncbi:MAG: hypothetical protein OXG51_09575 [Gammaproteobacteria bacterium]|nr:hypothetical protein [Gammaproteobacteria bacterium]
MAMRTFMNRSDTAPCRPGRLRAALSFTAALAVAAALSGCSTFGVAPFPELIRPPIEAAFKGVPIVAFINEVFGTQLGMSFVISPGLQEKTDLVTLRLTSPVPPRQFFSTARQVLQEYGVTIRVDAEMSVRDV